MFDSYDMFYTTSPPYFSKIGMQYEFHFDLLFTANPVFLRILKNRVWSDSSQDLLNNSETTGSFKHDLGCVAVTYAGRSPERRNSGNLICLYASSDGSERQHGAL